MMNKLRLLIGDRKGFTLLEIMVTVAIVAVIGISINSVICQLITISAADKNHMEAVKQVENALHWINRDGQQAWTSEMLPGIDQPFTSPLILTWTDTEAATHVVTYSCNSENCLQRIENTNGTSNTLNIAQNIDSVGSRHSFNGRTLSITIMATVPGFRSHTETRTLTITPRVPR